MVGIKYVFSEFGALHDEKPWFWEVLSHVKVVHGPPLFQVTGLFITWPV